MKRYIFMTYDIHPVGGCQNYLSGKCPYLETRGWEVFVLFAGINSNKFEFKILSKYAQGNIPELDFVPAELSNVFREWALKRMESVITTTNAEYVETIIESHYDKMHLWGELLAERLKGKHMCFNCNELFRGKDKYFDLYLDFYEFKFLRRELFGIVEKSMGNLFDGYHNIDVANTKPFVAAIPEAIQDVPCPELSTFPKADWTICYFGRILKSYVDRVFSDVSLFAQKHSDKQINFVIIGDEKSKLEMIHRLFDPLENVRLVFMGNQVPVPRMIIRRMDVIIAGAGCAVISSRENVPVIVPDPETCLSNGLLCFENISAVTLDEGRTRETFVDSLERVLVKQVHLLMPLKFTYPQVSPDDTYDNHMKLIEASVSTLEFYPKSSLVEGSYSLLRKVGTCVILLYRKTLSLLIIA